MISNQDTLNDVKSHVSNLFRSGDDRHLYYHNLCHTESVVEHATHLAKHYNLSEKDRFTVLVACWFHDVGYLKQRGDHEVISAEFAVDFLRSKRVAEDHILEIKNCILVTRMPQKSSNLLNKKIWRR